MAFSFFRWEALERMKDNLNLTESQWDGVRAAAVMGGLAVVGAVGYWGGLPIWAHWQSRQALAQSRAFAEKKDYGSMVLALRRATLLAPRDRFVWEETARGLGQIGSPEELAAREELTRLEPQDEAVRLAFVQEALRFGRYDTARSALDAVESADRQKLEFQRLAVALAVAQRQPEEMRIQLARLIALEPGNHNARFTYAALQLWGPEPGAAMARTELEKLLDDPSIRIRAAIELIVEAARRGGPRRVHQVIGRCLAVFAPAAIARTSGSEVRAWEALLQGMQAAAPPSPTDTALLARWLADLRRRPEALLWLKNLPPALRSSGPVLDLTAQLSAEEHDFPALESALKAGAWGAWPAEAWRRAIEYEERRLRRPGTASGAPNTWAAVIAADGSLDSWRNLARLATAWESPADAEAAWLAIIDHDPSVVWAYEALRSSYLSRHDLNDLLALYARWEEQFPLDNIAAERWLTLAALLDRTSAAINSRAESLDQTDAAATIAKAAVLWRRDRSAEAEALLQTLSDSERKSADASFWITLTESSLYHREAARDALKIAESYPRGPEETQLLRAAAQKIKPRSDPAAGTY